MDEIKGSLMLQLFGGVARLNEDGTKGNYLNNLRSNGVANVGLFFVPPINCQTPKSVNNIPAINEIGGALFSGVVTIVTETDSEVLINGEDISNFNANQLADRTIVTNQHCFGCTAGEGSSCQGVVV